LAYLVRIWQILFETMEKEKLPPASVLILRRR
jgi:hypothetical protein